MFKIGDPVEFRASHFRRDNNKRILSLMKSPINKGVIVGASYKSEGTIHHEYDEGDYFETTKRIFCYKIRTGMLNKEEIALPEDITLIFPFKIPMLKQPEWTDEMREKLSRESKEYARGEKGRWK